MDIDLARLAEPWGDHHACVATDYALPFTTNTVLRGVGASGRTQSAVQAAHTEHEGGRATPKRLSLLKPDGEGSRPFCMAMYSLLNRWPSASILPIFFPKPASRPRSATRCADPIYAGTSSTPHALSRRRRQSHEARAGTGGHGPLWRLDDNTQHPHGPAQQGTVDSWRSIYGGRCLVGNRAHMDDGFRSGRTRRTHQELC